MGMGILICMIKLVDIMLYQKFYKCFTWFLLMMLKEMMTEHWQLQKLMQFCVCQKKHQE